MDPALRDMLTDTLLVASVTGRDEFGIATYSTPVAWPARIQRRILTLFATTGRQLVPETKVFLDGDAVITEKDKVTFPDNSTPPIQGIEVHKDEFGVIDHYVLVF